MTRTMIATVLTAMLGASLAVAQTTGTTTGTAPATGKPTTTQAVPSSGTSSTTPGSTSPARSSTTAGATGTAAPNHYTTEAAAKAACGSDTVVWANTGHSHVYHTTGDKYYGHTHHGAYMCMKDAVAAGYHPPHSTAKPSTASTHS